jgi:hypothetical protein
VEKVKAKTGRIVLGIRAVTPGKGENKGTTFPRSKKPLSPVLY